MGLILDSTDLVYAERHGISVLNLLAAYAPETDLGISVITLAELQHGVRRASHPKQRFQRETFLHEVRRALNVVAVTEDIALLAGELDADLHVAGEPIALADLLIAATALTGDATLTTRNLRHFQRIPALKVISPRLP